MSRCEPTTHGDRQIVEAIAFALGGADQIRGAFLLIGTAAGRMGPGEWERRAAERHGQTVAEQRAQMESRGRKLVPCDCDWHGCEGWVFRYPTIAEEMADAEAET